MGVDLPSEAEKVVDPTLNKLLVGDSVALGEGRAVGSCRDVEVCGRTDGWFWLPICKVWRGVRLCRSSGVWGGMGLDHSHGPLGHNIPDLQSIQHHGSLTQAMPVEL